MSEHPYKPQPWRLTDYYPEAYARFMDILGDGIVPDWDDDDHNRHEAEFRADLAAHDAELREQIAAEAQEALSAHFRTLVHPMTPFADTAREVHGYRAATWAALNAIRNPKEKP